MESCSGICSGISIESSSGMESCSGISIESSSGMESCSGISMESSSGLMFLKKLKSY